MLDKIKTFGVPIAVVILVLAAFFYGAHVERLKADKEIADLRTDYATRETEALREAENIRKQQEQKYKTEMAKLKRTNADLALDTARVREQFDQLKSRRSPDIELCNNRANRCNGLLSEAYSLASEGEGLLRERDARLKVIGP